MLYFSRFQALDPYLAFSVGGRRFAVTPEMEYGRMAKESAFDDIQLLNEDREGAAKRFKLPKGMLVTIEPGLYHEGLGGCRIEDMVHVAPGGCELISKAFYKWEIP